MHIGIDFTKLNTNKICTVLNKLILKLVSLKVRMYQKVNVVNHDESLVHKATLK